MEENDKQVILRSEVTVEARIQSRANT